MFSKILIANRGEIAVRIIRACREMGIATVAVYSEADRGALHVALADQSYCIGGPDPSESYLNQSRIISAAVLAGAQAIHPGYGFLSENAGFARLCQKNGLVFIGPDPDIMEALSDKAVLKERVREAGVAVIPGTRGVTGLEEARAAAEKIGYPVMLKACAGGGGRGIRLVREEAELEEAYLTAAGEAALAFGDRSIYLEKYIFPARHVELQILADERGNAVCLGDRDCSLQRRHQKLVEETPSPASGCKGRQKDGICWRRDPGVPAGPGGEFLVYGNESPPAGGALHYGDADRSGSGQVADPGGGGGPPCLRPVGYPAGRHRHGVPDQRPGLRKGRAAPCVRRPLGAVRYLPGGRFRGVALL